MTTWDAVADLPLVVEDYALHGHTLDVSSEFRRQSTEIILRGAGAEGTGEDVTYDGPDQEALQAAGPVQPLAGRWTLGTFCDHVEALDLWPAPPVREPSRQYRVWAYESAALDLALRQASLALHEALGREPRPVRYVVSLRLGEPPTLEPVTRRLERYPSTRFKLDATSDWTPEIFDALRATGAVDSIDLKGLYEGSIVDQGADAGLYARVADAFPEAWIEDPKLTPETDAVLRPHRDRITWDANIHAVADIEALPFPPRMVNVKPSRFGPLRELFAAYDHCAARGIGMYGGGQFELGVGRGQIQLLAGALPPRRAQRRRAGRLQRARPAARAAREPARPGPGADGLPAPGLTTARPAPRRALRQRRGERRPGARRLDPAQHDRVAPDPRRRLAQRHGHRLDRPRRHDQRAGVQRRALALGIDAADEPPAGEQRHRVVAVLAPGGGRVGLETMCEREDALRSPSVPHERVERREQRRAMAPARRRLERGGIGPRRDAPALDLDRDEPGVGDDGVDLLALEAVHVGEVGARPDAERASGLRDEARAGTASSSGSSASSSAGSARSGRS